MPEALLNRQSWHYHTWGTSGNPALLLLHGFTGTHRSWASLAERWATRYFVVAPDLPGHGQTETPEDPESLSMRQTAARLAQLLDQLSIAKAAVIGYSMGGRLALHAAWLHPNRIAALILESASPGLADVDARRTRRNNDEALADTIEARGLSWFVPYWANQPLFAQQAEAVRAEENRIRHTQSPHGLAQSLRGAGTGRQDSLWHELPALGMPVLLITGRKDEKFCRTAEKMRDMMPHSEWVVVDQAGHTVHGEAPDAFYQATEHFLAQHGLAGDRS